MLSLLAKTEFAVPRVVARVNDPRNEFDVVVAATGDDKVNVGAQPASQDRIRGAAGGGLLCLQW